MAQLWRKSVLVVLSLAAIFPITASGEADSSLNTGCSDPPSTELVEERPLHDHTIVLDPGHGGNDVGAVAHGLLESEVVLEITNRLSERLLESGARVCLTRIDDRYLSRSERAEFANQAGGDLFVSIHLNNFDDRDVDYALTLWQSRNDRRLAQTVLGPLVEELSVAPDGEDSPVDGGRHAKFNSGMLRDARMPAIIVEPVFMSNVWEADALTRDDLRQEQIVSAVHDGLVLHVGTDHPLLVDLTMNGQDLIDTGLRGWLSWLEMSGIWDARKFATGIHASAGLDHLSLLGMDIR